MSKTIFENERGFFLSAGPAGNVYARTGQALLGEGGSLGPLQLVVECSEVTHKAHTKYTNPYTPEEEAKRHYKVLM